MNSFLNADGVGTLGDPGPGAPMTPGALGEHAAHMVWESYSDFMTSEALDVLVAEAGIPTLNGIPEDHPAKELLIFHLWAHTRAIQLGLAGRGEERGMVQEALDALHRAVFEDLAATGYPRARLPLFEQRVSARYAEYYAAAERGDGAVGQAALAHLSPVGALAGFAGPGPSANGRAAFRPEIPAILTHRAIEVTRPFRDYLEQVELRSEATPEIP
jgi:hypothetical protein